MIKWDFYFNHEHATAETNEPSVDENIKKSLLFFRNLNNNFLHIPGKKEIFVNLHKVKCVCHEEIDDQTVEGA